MVSITYNKVERVSHNEHILTLEGHADYAETGKDIVCAAVSILVTSLAAMLDYFDDDFEKAVVEEGNVDIRFNAGIADPFADTVFQMAMEGFELLADKYPDHVSIT